MKRLFVTLFLVFSSAAVFGQGYYGQGVRLLNFSFGVENVVRPSGFRSKIPPLVAEFEYGLSSKISLAGYIGYSSAKYDYHNNIAGTNYHYRWNSSHLVLGLKGAYHLGEWIGTQDYIDPYVGLMVGNNIVSVNREQLAGGENLGPMLDPMPSSHLMVGAFFGARYFVNNKTAIFGEFGYTTSVLKLGLSMKI